MSSSAANAWHCHTYRACFGSSASPCAFSASNCSCKKLTSRQSVKHLTSVRNGLAVKQHLPLCALYLFHVHWQKKAKLWVDRWACRDQGWHFCMFSAAHMTQLAHAGNTQLACTRLHWSEISPYCSTDIFSVLSASALGLANSTRGLFEGWASMAGFNYGFHLKLQLLRRNS